MLEKMGWKEGEGLGRNRQGMATPLVMQASCGCGSICCCCLLAGRYRNLIMCN